MEIRRKIAKKYDKAFKGTAVHPIMPKRNVNHAYHLYVIEIANRKEVYDYLRAHQIFSQVHYIPVHLQPYYQDQGFKKGDYPLAEKYYDHCLSLPMYPTLTDEEQAYVIETVLKIAKA